MQEIVTGYLTLLHLEKSLNLQGVMVETGYFWQFIC